MGWRRRRRARRWQRWLVGDDCIAPGRMSIVFNLLSSVCAGAGPATSCAPWTPTALSTPCGRPSRATSRRTPATPPAWPKPPTQSDARSARAAAATTQQLMRQSQRSTPSQSRTPLRHLHPPNSSSIAANSRGGMGSAAGRVECMQCQWATRRTSMGAPCVVGRLPQLT